MPDLKTIWSQRFHGWYWLLLPLLATMALAGLLTLAGALPAPTAHQRAALAVLVLFALALSAVGAWRISRALTPLTRTARHLAHGRYESRAGVRGGGTTAELAQQLNALAKMLAQYRDHHDEMVTRTTTRLRQDQERLQELNLSLREALTQSQESARAQSELFSNLSHELRTPLTAILGYADLLRRSGLNHEQEPHLATLDKAARALLTMINDLLDWSRIEAGRLRLNEEPFEVLDTAEDTTAMLAPLAYEKDLELVRIIYHDVPRRLQGDAQRLRQILTNLLSNAIKFTERGEVVLRVMREREQGGRVWLRFSVSDTGIGIPAEQQARLFQPFHQLGRASTVGSGLGLSITRKLTELMGGRVELDSTPGRGSTFSVVAPFGLLADAAGSPTHDTRLRERSAWLLEAHPTARLALTHWLEFWGMRASSFTSSRELLDSVTNAAPNTRPDVVIIGLRADDANDPALLRLLGGCREQKAPTLVLVASASLEMHESLRRAGADACHPKSIGRLTLQDELVRLTSADKSAAGRPLSGRRALIADNNLPNRRYLAALCGGLGLQASEAQNGREALDLWLEGREEFVLLDARMPRLDGPGCAREIRRAEQGQRRCRIIAVSAHLEPEERKAFLDAGADEVLIKPFDERQLLRALAPGLGASPAPVSTLLAEDPEMLKLLREDLPEQFEELIQACSNADLAAARAAAHQLRGTAAFYHLAGLRQATAALELWLGRTTTLVGNPHLARELDSVRRAVGETLESIEQKKALAPT